MYRTVVGLAAFVSLGIALLAAPRSASTSCPSVVGLDHVPIAVANLEAAAERYRALGFALKPGRPHDNGIRNQHAKFPDGTELELITAPEARDALTATYRRHLARGDGPAFLALYAPSMEAVHEDIGDRAGLDYLFLARRNHSPTDRPEHLAHANGASSLVAVWLAGADLATERRLFASLGARIVSAEVRLPEHTQATLARFAEGDVVLLPNARQLVEGRKIVGVTLRVQTLAAIEAVLASDLTAPAAKAARREGTSLFLPPAITHGLWLEFRESR